ncbi:MAG TPA: hypothetical protein VF747_01040 [Blastocatellia bacterium]|jgi:hypothetical protein
MANNIPIIDQGGATKTLKTTDNAGIHTPHHNVDQLAAGASADIGALGDAKVITDATGSVLAFLRGIVYLIATLLPASLGQKLMAASLSVVIASDQTAIPIAAGSASIGGVKWNGVHWAASPISLESADLSSIGDLTQAPTSGQKIVIDELWVSTITAMTLTITEETTLTVLKTFYLPANSEPFLFKPLVGLKLATADKKARIQASAAGSISIYASYHSEA